MVFLGDYAIVDQSELANIDFGNEQVVVNLEGAILNRALNEAIRKSVLFNTEESITLLKKVGTTAVVIANNHFYDLDKQIDHSRVYLQENGIRICGAGNSLEEAKKELIIQEESHDYVILAFCWNVTGGKYARHNCYGVNPLTKDNVLESVRTAREKYADATIVAVMHWGIELEKYPEPMHVQLAHAAIEEGADVIIGHHPHRIQPIEKYKGKYIFYSIGNFDIQERRYFDGRMTYPEFSKKGLAVSIKRDCIQCKIIKKSSTGALTMENTSVEEALQKYPFPSVENYGIWFRKNRVKRKGIPIFYDIDHSIANHCKTFALTLRYYIIKVLLLFRLKKGRSTNEE